MSFITTISGHLPKLHELPEIKLLSISGNKDLDDLPKHLDHLHPENVDYDKLEISDAAKFIQQFRILGE